MAMNDEVARLTALRHAADNLRAMRKQRDMTIRDVEAVSGGTISRQDIVRLENASISRPSMEMLVKVGRFYGYTPNQMAALYGYWDPNEELGVAMSTTPLSVGTSAAKRTHV